MKEKSVIVSEILKILESSGILFKYIGDANCCINGFSSLYNYREGTITWCKKKIPAEIEESIDLRLIVAGDVNDNIGRNVIVTNEPKKAFFLVIEELFGCEDETKIEDDSYISCNVKIGKNVKIGHNCTIEGNINIGDGVKIYNNVVIINNAKIGNNTIIQSGTIIGHDDFSYFEEGEGKKKMIRHWGGVEIGKDVFIGAKCLINRGTIDNTIIEDGVKIDANCHISHNSIIKQNAVLISGTIVYGSVKIGENAYIASSIIKNQKKIGRNAIVGMGSTVLEDIEENVVFYNRKEKIKK